MKNLALLRHCLSIVLIAVFSFNATSQVNTNLIASECNWQAWSVTQSPQGCVFAFFPTGPMSPPMTDGSAQFNISAPNAAIQLQTATFAGTPMSSITSLEYYSFIENFGTAGEDIYLQLNVDYNGDGTAEDKLFFQPNIQGGTVPLFHDWLLWDAKNGLWWSQNGEAGATTSNPKSLATILSAHPSAKLATGNSIIVNAGNEAADWSGFQGNIDGLKIGIGATSKTFDFESSEGQMTLWFKDADGDGWGNTNISIEDCTKPQNYVENNWDCDDDNTKKKEQILVCRDNKEKCIKFDDLEKYVREGYVAGPCAIPCKGNKVLMCHNGKMKCVKPEDVEKRKSKHWTVGRCGAVITPQLVNADAVQQIQNVEIPTQINILSFPNPTTGRFNIDLSAFKNQKLALELTSDRGQVIERRTVKVYATEQTESFDLSTKREGLYILKIINDKSVHTVKVIVSR